MGRFLAATLRALPSAEPRHIARMLWALAKLQWKPAASWADRVFQQTELQVRRLEAGLISLGVWRMKFAHSSIKVEARRTV
eukprot:scaffold190499_cov18-Tisochrysis_lutea.AAC.1